jgi:general secretion pathway protein D
MARAGDEAETLNRAIQLFEQGEYLSAQELLLGIDRNKLNKSQQAQRDDCLNRVQVALIMSEKALRDAEDAETAVAAGEMDRARLLLEGIQANPYAKQEFKQAAAARLRQLPGAPAQPETPVQPREPASPEKPAQPNESAPKKANGPNGTQAPPVSPADAERARVLIQEGQELIKAARYDEAERRFEEALRLVPGHPDAVAGIEQARQHAQIRAGTIGETLIERIRRQDEVNWQRTVTEYREAEGAIRGHVESERFEDANLLLVRARQIVEAGRQFADPITKYESLRGELEALERFVQEKERQYNEDKVAKVRREIEEQRSARLRQIEEDRARQVNALMEQAAQHRKDGNLAAAVEVLKQVIVIDPKYQPARWMMDILEDQRQYRKERDIVLEQRRQTRETLRDVEEAKIPWHEQLKYPKDWLEIISRPERQAPGKARRESRLWSALDAPIPVDFRREPLQQVLERLAEAHRLNLIVNWNDLQRAGVNRETAIDLSLPSEISLKRALTEILDQAGGGDVDLGFDVDDGAVTVATQSFLDKKTYVAMYDINDLLVTLPQFDKPPLTDLRAATRIQSSPRPAAGDAPWRVGDDDDDEPQEDPERLSRVRQLLDLIQDTVAPDSWRERGGSVGSIKEINGSLVITQNSAAQREIGDLLSSLRAERAIQIAVEAVFITVTSHYLEELGMNLNLLFNAGNAGLDFIPGAGGPAVDPVLGNRLLLPRQFSRLGFTPNTPALGTATATDPNIDPVPQPFGQPFLVPRRAGGSGRQLTPVPVRSSILDFTDPTNITSDIPGSFGGQQIGPALSIFGSFLDNIQVDFLIRATQADSRSSVLTAPRVVVFNGFGAWVAVTISQNFISTLNPVVAQQAVAQAPIIGTIDAGAVLVIQQAVVSADKRYVMMILNPGVTRLIDLQSFPFSGGSFALDAFVQLPTLSSLRIQTAVNVPDGGTLLIGGQRLASETEIEAGVPILSKLPILKRAYNARTTVKDEQTLLILIKPKILIQTEQEELAFPSFNR